MNVVYINESIKHTPEQAIFLSHQPHHQNGQITSDNVGRVDIDYLWIQSQILSSPIHGVVLMNIIYYEKYWPCRVKRE